MYVCLRLSKILDRNTSSMGCGNEKRKKEHSKKEKDFQNPKRKNGQTVRMTANSFPEQKLGYKQPNQCSLDSRLSRGSEVSFEASDALPSGCVEWLILKT